MFPNTLELPLAVGFIFGGGAGAPAPIEIEKESEGLAITADLAEEFLPEVP
jgi:hypothetical protein